MLIVFYIDSKAAMNINVFSILKTHFSRRVFSITMSGIQIPFNKTCATSFKTYETGLLVYKFYKNIAFSF